ncbi:MAG: hypothetical protein CMJ45_02465 [Planctomyces sp.]|nr:hypothetical protein [Planctomyces sp.]
MAPAIERHIKGIRGTMTTAKHNTEHYLETARDLAAKVAPHVSQIEADRQFPSELSEAIADQGFFRLLIPRSMGGEEIDHPTFRKILDIFAEVDASTAWAVNQNNVFATDVMKMSEQVSHEIWDERRAVVTNGPPTKTAKAVTVDGGYKLSGLWNFSSGCDHATWIAALVPVWSQSQIAATGREKFRIMLMPKNEVTFVDQWHVNGMRGTASFSFELDEVFVPEYRTYSPDDPVRSDNSVYSISRTLLFAMGFATVAVGVARASLSAVIDLTMNKVAVRTTIPVHDLPTTHRLIGEAEAIWRSADAYLRETSAAVWEDASKNGALTTDVRIQSRLATTYAIQRSAEAVDICYRLSGSDAIFTPNSIHRFFQDIHVITQHAQGRPIHLETAGQYLLGMEPQGNF